MILIPMPIFALKMAKITNKIMKPVEKCSHNSKIVINKYKNKNNNIK